MKNFVFTGLILLFSVTAQAQIYKWVDENGKTQYTDQPPPPNVTTDVKGLNIKSAPMSGNSQTGKTKNLTEERLEFDKRRQQTKENEANQQAKAEENKKKCIDAQGRLKIYTDTPRLTVPDGAGGITYLDDDARQRKIDDVKKQIATYCK